VLWGHWGCAVAKNETILIIDDRRDNIELLVENILRPAGYSHAVAYDGEEGLKRATSEKPDLIIMDLNIPRLTGLEVLRRLREARNQVPVILMTFHGSEQAAVQAFRLGAQDYIIKPYNVDQMTGSIERALAGYRLRRETS
jgi:DNA-binding response OmpR family regulator